MSKTKKISIYFFKYVFALIMFVIGAFDLMQPESLKIAMEALTMPSYMLIILGIAKILGSLGILFNIHWRLTEWAYAGFFIWALGGISSHVLSSHSFSEILPIFILLLLLVASFRSHLTLKSL